MLEDIKRFVTDLIDGGKAQEHFDDNDYRVAAAALLVHVATLDGGLDEAERARLRAILQVNFALDEPRTDQLIAAAEAAERDAVDFYHFTSLIMRTLDEAGRARVIAMMWEIVLADGRVSEFEDNVMWRVSDLLGISTRQRVELRQQVAERAGPSGGAAAGPWGQASPAEPLVPAWKGRSE